MTDREKLAVALAESRYWPGVWEKMGEPEREFFREHAEKFLASDWLRDTLAAALRCFAEELEAAAIRNLEPEASDDARG